MRGLIRTGGGGQSPSTTDSSGNPVGVVTLAGTLPGTFHGTCLVNPGAAEQGAVQLWNPAASGVNLVIEDFWLTASGGDQVFVGYASTAALTTEEAVYIPQAMHPDEAQTRQGEIRTDVDNAGAGTVWTRVDCESNIRPQHVPHMIGKVFAPDTGVSFYGDTVNITSILTVVWREVAA